VKHKQEVTALRTELKQLQAESKTGQKGKDLVAKDLEAAKKKLGDLKAKLDAVVQDKLALQQVCARRVAVVCLSVCVYVCDAERMLLHVV
jgi:predicted  nucleic acid-binding Zn-ribbon protein